MTVNSWATPRWVIGMPATAGTATGLVRPGITVTGTPASRQAMTSSKPRPKTKLSPPLNRATRLPASARSTISRLISACCADRPRGSLATSISSTSGGSSPRSSRGASRSATTTSASISALRPAIEIRSGSPGPAADQGHPGNMPALVTRGDGALPQPGQDLVADRCRTPRIAVAEDRDRHAGCRAHSGSPRGRLGRVVGPHAEDPALLRCGGDAGVDLDVVGRCHGVPGAIEVLGLEPAPQPGELAGAGHPLDGRRDPGRDDVHIRAGGDQLWHSALGDVPAADHEHPSTLEAQPGGVRRQLVHARHHPGYHRCGP